MAGINAQLTNHMQSGLTDISVYQKGQLYSIVKHRQQGDRWVYLLANQLRFCQSQGYKIHLPRPDTDTTLVWLEKLIQSGQTCAIFVEDLKLDEVRQKRLIQLCKQMDVMLVNLNSRKVTDNTLVYGPW
ncbi:hypothetical protein [Lacimicrobium alkaliphilum]|nr:hypothetical protein [Lacimicrobium alkaliphilum]